MGYVQKHEKGVVVYENEKFFFIFIFFFWGGTLHFSVVF